MKKTNSKVGKKVKLVPVLFNVSRKAGRIDHLTFKEAEGILQKKPISQSQHQKEMDKIANNMAVLFEKKITASELAKWLTIANSHSNPNDDLIWSLGYNILPGLIDAKTQSDRINFLKIELPQTFNIYKFANESLFQIGEDYLKKSKGLLYFTELIEEFISVFLTLLAICEMFERYEYEEKEMDKQTEKAA